jgi:hypothetical protein
MGHPLDRSHLGIDQGLAIAMTLRDGFDGQHFRIFRCVKHKPFPSLLRQPNALGREIEGEPDRATLWVKFKGANGPIPIDANVAEKIGFSTNR